ncbi:MAG: tetratricopeptide repeat protein [Tabrizicola sp.]|uniref:tetratricopeptide repeat protein n=1 Tax=Tabrizicola sp. TaxID=2005166 RepID=UPI002ABB1F62|nr:tetratricopeptide repeat protein [Tabrizicola sp.]MDZ4085943.1 tetratricopeptide repeat protein [Tabrizicola sp.]
MTVKPDLQTLIRHREQAFARPLCPKFILDHHRAGRSDGVIDACAIDIDISGFSRVTDALSARGPEGAELLADVIRAIFEPLTACVHEFGGFVANYVGDGFLALFPQAPGLEDALRRGLAAGWEMRQTIRSRHKFRTPFGTFEINARIGIAEGQVRWRIFGDPQGRRHIYYFDGSPIVEVAKVRQLAGLGELFATSASAARFAEVATTRPTGDDLACHVENVDNLPLPSVLEPAPVAVDPLVAEFVPESIATASGTGEFRQTVNLFLKVEFPDRDLDRFVQAIFQAQDRFGGFINGLTDGDKGCSALVFWGAPIATEDDIGRALEFCSHVLTRPDLTISAGLTCGLAHAGFSGSTRQAVYTCSSRHVNLAARFMSAAKPGALYLDRAARDHALERFETDFVGNLELKGFSEPQPVYALGPRKVSQTRVATTGEIVEREAELSELLGTVETVFQTGQAGAAAVIGSAGSGKTAVLTALEERVLALVAKGAAPDARIVRLTAETGLGRPFGPFRKALETVLGLAGVAAGDQRRTTFDAALARLQTGTDSVPVKEELGLVRFYLAALVDVNLAGSTFAQVPELRTRNIARALIVALQALAGSRRLIVIADDLNAFDADSLDSLRQLTDQTAVPVAVIASSRLDDRGEVPALPFAPERLVTTISMRPLSAEAVRVVAETALGAPVSTRVVDYLLAKTGGNPLYLEQLILTLNTSGDFLHRGAGQTTRVELAPNASAHIPQGLSGVLVARIDRLPARLKSVIQVAAVLGYEFEVPLLAAMLGDDALVAGALEAGQAQQIWDEQSPGRFRFRHAMLRDSVYDMQLVVVRRNLHRQAAQALEQLEGQPDLLRLGALAYHFEHAEMPEMAQRYLLRAGDMAHDSYDVPNAVRYYRLLLKHEIETGLQVRVAARLGALLVLTGDWEEALATLDSGLSAILGADDPAQELEILIALGDVLRQSGDFARARERLELARAIARRSGNELMLCKALGILAGTYKYSGDYPRALVIYQEALVVAERVQEDNMIAVSLAGIASIHGLLGAYEKAIDHNRRAIPILERLGNRHELVYPIANLGIDLYTIGEHEEALAILERALLESSAIGDRTGIWFAYHFIGRLHHETGAFQRAIQAYERAMLDRRTLGGDSIPYNTLPHLASAKASLGQDAAAIAALSAHLDVLDGGEPDHEHGLTYMEIAGLLSRLADLAAEDRAALDTLAARVFGDDPLDWLKAAEERARAGESMGLNSRIRILVACAAHWFAQGGITAKVTGCLAAGERLATTFAMAREAGFVRDRAREMGISADDLARADPLYQPFDTA